jgi:hypothetical protein
VSVSFGTRAEHTGRRYNSHGLYANEGLVQPNSFPKREIHENDEEQKIRIATTIRP